MAESRVELDGVNYYTLYELPDSQDSNAPCVLLVHALMSNLHMYDNTVKALHQAGYSTLRYDHMGHNNTPPPASQSGERRTSQGGSLAYHMDDLARHMHQIVQARTGQTHLKAVIGCSIGGVLALRYSMMFPQDVDCAISVAAPPITYPEEAKALWSQRIKQFEEDEKTGGDELCRATADRWFPGGPEVEAVREQSYALQKTVTIQGYKLLTDTIRNYDYYDELDKIQNVRCIVAGGTEDGAISLSHLEHVAGKIEGARYVEFQGAGHLPPMQQPEKFNELMLSFLAGP